MTTLLTPAAQSIKFTQNIREHFHLAPLLQLYDFSHCQVFVGLVDRGRREVFGGFGFGFWLLSWLFNGIQVVIWLIGYAEDGNCIRHATINLRRWIIIIIV